MDSGPVHFPLSSPKRPFVARSLLLTSLLSAAFAPLVVAQDKDPFEGWQEGLKTITEEDLEGHLLEIASPHLEGRDSPSEGLSRAADYIEKKLREAGIEAGWDKGYRHTFSVRRRTPDEKDCSLRYELGDGEESSVAELGKDWVPFPNCDGSGSGALVFLGFGISSKRYDDIGKRSYKGKIALILSGEPRHKRILEGPVISAAADTYAKVKELEKRGCSGVLIVRRRPAELEGPDKKPLPPTPLGYRYTWASWLQAAARGWTAPNTNTKIPVAEITEELASTLLGQDVGALAARIDKKGKSERIERDLEVTLKTGKKNSEVPCENVFGMLKGSDPELSKEIIVIGAHYDHVGVDHWTRVGSGADDNGSGTCATLELAQALAAHPPRRSVVFAFFSAEEDGLIGSAQFAEELPFLTSAEGASRTSSEPPVVAMLNMDMVGRGKDREVLSLIHI